MAFQIKHSHGATSPHIDDYQRAIAKVREAYPDCAVGHSGDIRDGGPRTLVWPDETTAQGDDGANACAVIERV